MSPLDALAPGAVDASSSNPVENATATDGAQTGQDNLNPEGLAPEGEAEGGDEPGIPAIEAPASLNAESKAMFAQLPPEAQRWWVDTETTRARQVTEATTRAAEAQRSAQSEAARVGAEAKANFAQQLSAFTSAYQPQRPNPGDYGDMQAFARADAQFQHDLAQHRELVQQVEAIGAEATQELEGQQAQWAQAEVRRLHQAFPDWFDETKGAEHKARLTAVGAELGYSSELMSQAGADDILALRKAADWKAKADKYDTLMKQRMQPVRAARQAPPNARGAAPGTQAQAPDVAATLYPNDVRR